MIVFVRNKKFPLGWASAQTGILICITFSKKKFFQNENYLRTKSGKGYDVIYSFAFFFEVRIFGYCDQVMEKVLQKMNIKIPSSFPKVNCQSTRNMIKKTEENNDKEKNIEEEEEEEEEAKTKNSCKKRKHGDEEYHVPRKKIKLKKDEN